MPGQMTTDGKSNEINNLALKARLLILQASLFLLRFHRPLPSSSVVSVTLYFFRDMDYSLSLGSYTRILYFTHIYNRVMILRACCKCY
jgi:hypothetical protein